jgi:regulator of protease activity HflC (stomatin/prohibitin superfamily)
MKYLLFPALVATLALGACDSKPVQDEKAANKEEAKSMDKEADAVKAEGKAEAKKAEAAGDKRSEDLKASADKKADDIKAAADAKKDEKPAGQ